MRQTAPIFLALSSPASRIAITSASETPSTLAASAGLSRSGIDGGRAGGRDGRRRAAAAEALLHHLLRDAEADRQLGRRAAAPPRRRRSRSPCAIWYFTKSLRLPIAAMLDRLSIACSTSGGTDTFSTMKLVDLDAVLRVTAD